MTPWLFWSFWQQSFGPRSFMDMWVLQVNHHHNCFHLHHHHHHQHHHHTWVIQYPLLVYNVTPGSQTLIGPFLDKDSHASNNFAIKQVFCFLWCKTPSPLSICFIEIPIGILSASASTFGRLMDFWFFNISIYVLVVAAFATYLVIDTKVKVKIHKMNHSLYF